MLFDESEFKRVGTAIILMCRQASGKKKKKKAYLEHFETQIKCLHLYKRYPHSL